MTKKLMLGAALSALTLSGALAQMPTGPSPRSAPPAAIDQAKPADKTVTSKPARRRSRHRDVAEARPVAGVQFQGHRRDRR